MSKPKGDSRKGWSSDGRKWRQQGSSHRDIQTKKNLTGKMARWYLTVQQFAPTIKCVPGKSNCVADALPRNIPVGAIIDNPPCSNFTLVDLGKAQREYEVWKRVIYAIESGG